ncbi:hypothetical protein ACFL35_18925 [Candidatus Riflebacteria bacterium]
MTKFHELIEFLEESKTKFIRDKQADEEKCWAAVRAIEADFCEYLDLPNFRFFRLEIPGDIDWSYKYKEMVLKDGAWHTMGMLTIPEKVDERLIKLSLALKNHKDENTCRAFLVTNSPKPKGGLVRYRNKDSLRKFSKILYQEVKERLTEKWPSTLG